ncbi:MAG: hypothetical protein KDA63_06200 [Planctomycetales bacterium]|nr:hypothetical protein [Planctomycetales bacterium]
MILPPILQRWRCQIMLPDPQYTALPLDFWACVRTLSQRIGYTVRGEGRVRVPTIDEIEAAFDDLGLDPAVLSRTRSGASVGNQLCSYYEHRAGVLNDVVEPLLMNATEAKRHFRRLKKQLRPTCPLPMNKQKKEKRAEAYLTCIVNMLIEAHANGATCDYDPRQLTSFTRKGLPVRTLSRRVDGAFPSVLNPTAVWEIKEYYYTTTFGSRVADGVYETLLDGMELEELRASQGVHVSHYLIVDDHYTWWTCGKSYLCRLIDMLHMGYVDEVLFGREVLTRVPELVATWVT